MSVRERARQRGVLFPNFSLASPTRVRELVALGRLPYSDWMGKLAASDEEAVDGALRMAGCLDWQSRWVAELSDGEKQRVYLAQGVSILLLDEPTAFIDLPQRIEVAKVLKEWARQEGRGVILSTHDLDLAMATADRIWILERGGAWTSGIPEELAMNGTLGRVFESPDATIDRSTGRLVWCLPGGREIAIRGEGSRFDWTMRALVRTGYRIETSADWLVRISSPESNQSAWSLSHGSTKQEFNSIEDLLDYLRSHHPPRA
jgi:iron complex transport system ATP-binding protein